ncbi:hypothetical protein PPNSA23_00110 [Phyllobacterium phragmitis]|uniref:Uncharacterized protein n=1 Tax=Phyllobacterium phragmitis TaxID=2670329 RepID=A0ABQ0GTR9_9HYPH
MDSCDKHRNDDRFTVVTNSDIAARQTVLVRRLEEKCFYPVIPVLVTGIHASTVPPHPTSRVGSWKFSCARSLIPILGEHRQRHDLDAFFDQ